jgi:dihydroneopterin aldolase
MRTAIADAHSGLRHVFLRDMVVHGRVGIYPHERASAQRIRINVDLGVTEQQGGADRLDRVVDYEKVANTVRSIATAGHVNLVETLAERIATACLRDPRVRMARIRVEKLDVFEDTFSAGVEIERVAHRLPSTAP